MTILPISSQLLAAHYRYEDLQREADIERLVRSLSQASGLSSTHSGRARTWMWYLRLGWLVGLGLLALLLVSTAAAQGSSTAVRQVHLPVLIKTPGSGHGGGQSASFFLPHRPGGSLVTTGLPKVAIDATGGIHAVYAARTPDSSGARPAYYAYCPAHCTSAAAFVTVSLGDLMSYAELALDPQGHPRLLLVSGDSNGQQHYVYGECDRNCTSPSQWTLTLVATGHLSFFPSRAEQKMTFALDAQGRPGFVLYTNPFGAPDGGIFYLACAGACTDAANWTATKLSHDEWKNLSLAYTRNGFPRLAFTYQDAKTYAPLVAYLECNTLCTNGANWHGVVLVGTATSGPMSDNTFALRVDKQNGAGLVLYPGSGSGGTLPPNRLYYLSCTARCVQTENWQLLDIDLPNFAGEGGVDLVFDQQNRPRVAARIPAPTDEVAYAWCDQKCAEAPQNWQHRIIPTTAAAQQEFPLLPMQGCPSPTCIPPIPPCTSAFWDAGYWPSLALDAAGNPALVFDLKHQHANGGCTAGSFVRLARLVTFAQP